MCLQKVMSRIYCKTPKEGNGWCGKTRAKPARSARAKRVSSKILWHQQKMGLQATNHLRETAQPEETVA